MNRLSVISLIDEQQFSGFPGLRHLLGWLEGARRIGVGRQLIAMGVGMGIMPGRKRRFCLRVMGCVGRKMIRGVVLFPLIIAFLILAGLRPEVGLRVMGMFSGFVSR
jgi:hypothetical protein